MVGAETCITYADVTHMRWYRGVSHGPLRWMIDVSAHQLGYMCFELCLAVYLTSFSINRVPEIRCAEAICLPPCYCLNVGNLHLVCVSTSGVPGSVAIDTFKKFV